MKRVFLIISCLVLLITDSSAAYGNESIRLTNGEWPPYTSEKLKHYGMFSRIVTEAFSIENIAVEYEFYPWKRSYHLAKSGEFDGSIAWADTNDRQEDFYFSNSVISVDKVFFHLKSFSFDWDSINDLKQYRIGGTLGYTYGEAFDKAVKNKDIYVQYITHDIQNIKKLMSGKIEIFPMEINVGYELIKTELDKKNVSLITHHHKPVVQTSTCVVISKKIGKQRAQKLIAAFNRGLQELKNNGRYDQILKLSSKVKK